MIKNDPFGMVQRATKKAFERVGRVAGMDEDPDVRLYATLKPEEFTKLMGVYGESPIIDYIRDMESRKIMGGK